MSMLQRGNTSSRFSSNSEAFASELLANLKEYFSTVDYFFGRNQVKKRSPVYYIFS